MVVIIVKKSFIFEGNATVAQCHAATVVALNDKTIVSAFFAGSAEGKNDVSIWCARRINGEWSIPFRITEDDGVPHWNPVLFSSDGKNLTLFYKVGYKISEWKTFWMTSADGGKNWTEAKELVEGDISGGRGPVKNKPIMVNDKMIAPASSEQGSWRCFVDVFENGVWEKKNIPISSADSEELALIQPTFWQSSGGFVHAMMRSNKGLIYRTDSDDFGYSWSECYPTAMPNNNSGIDCVKVDDKLFLVCNPISKNWGERSPLTLFLSKDNGKTFDKVLDLESGKGEFSYPSIIQKEDKIYIVYTYKREKIAFCELNINDFTG